MKKLFVLPILTLLIISMVTIISATTVVGGKIYDADFSNTVSGATVTVTCNGTTLAPVTSGSDGQYAAGFTSNCDDGADISIHAIKAEVGENTLTGKINDDGSLTAFNVILSINNVPLVPEFGVFVGALTILSAVGVFFLVRKE